MIRWCCTLLLLGSMWAAAQDEVEGYSEPLLDAISVFQTEPLCLYTATTRTLTAIPGVSARTAATILRMAHQHHDSTWLVLEQCLPTEQFLVLRMCATLECDSTIAPPWRCNGRYRYRSSDAGISTAARTQIQWGDFRTGWSESVTSGESPQTIWFFGSTSAADVAAGSYAIRSGCGLVLGGGGSIVSSRSQARNVSPSPTLRQWSSTYSEGAFQGGAVQVRHKGMAATTAYSNAIRHGRRERAILGSMGGSIRGIHTTITAIDVRYDAATDSRAANRVAGTHSWIASLCTALPMHNGNLTWELAYTKERAWAATIVGEHPVWPDNPMGFSDLVWCVLYYDRTFRSPYASSMSPWGDPTNAASAVLDARGEKYGWRWQLAIQTSERLGTSFGAVLPITRTDVLLSLQKRLSPSCSIELRATTRMADDQAASNLTAQPTVEETSRWTLRADAEYSLSRTIVLYGRLHLLRYNESYNARTQNGWAGITGMNYMPWPWCTVRLRYAAYTSSSLNVAAYVLETDAVGSMRIVPLLGRGPRLHASIKAKSPAPYLPSVGVFIAADRSGIVTSGMQFDASLTFP